MKLLTVTPYFLPHIGGVENYVYNINLGLKDKYGWDVVVVTSNHKEKKYLEEEVEGIKVYRLPRWFTVSNTPINPLWPFQIAAVIRKENPDAIIAHTPVPYLADVTASVCGNIPFVLTYHALSLYKLKNPVFNLCIFLYKTLIERRTLKKAKIIIAESKPVEENFPCKLRKKTIVINNSISAREILPKLVIRKKKNKIIFLSNLDKTHSWKGLENILEAIKWYVQNLSKDIELVVVGDGNHKKYYEMLVEELELGKYVKFVGSKFGKEKYSFIRESKILVTYPKTSNDAFPTVFLEAWANLVPIISSNINPIPHIVDNMVNGYLVKPSSPKELAKGIYELVQNDGLCNKLIRNGWYKVKEYTWDKQVRKTVKIFKK